MLLGSFENNALERAGKGQSVTHLERKIMGLKRKLNLKSYQLYIYLMITRITKITRILIVCPFKAHLK